MREGEEERERQEEEEEKERAGEGGLGHKKSKRIKFQEEKMTENMK